MMKKSKTNPNSPRMNLKMNPFLHEQLKLHAKKENVSQQLFCENAILFYIKALEKRNDKAGK